MMKQKFNIIFCVFIINILLNNNSYSNDSFYDENCFLEKNYVLLYKIINWWNDCVPDDDFLLCNYELRCELSNSTKIKYDNKNQQLIIDSKYFIEELISLFSECEDCKKQPFKCTYINTKYFGNINIENVRSIDSTINSIAINNVTENQAKILIEVEKFINIEIKGKIGGLLLNTGRIALHQSGNFLKRCPKQTPNESNNVEISVIVKNMKNNEIIAKFKNTNKES